MLQKKFLGSHVEYVVGPGNLCVISSNVETLQIQAHYLFCQSSLEKYSSDLSYYIWLYAFVIGNGC